MDEVYGEVWEEIYGWDGEMLTGRPCWPGAGVTSRGGRTFRNTSFRTGETKRDLPR